MTDLLTWLLKLILPSLLALLGLSGCCICIQPTHELAWQLTQETAAAADAAAVGGD